MCKGQTNLSSDPIRKTFRDQHNHKRSAVAMGTAKMVDGKTSRNATKMWKLEYNCGLEASAYAAAKGCKEVNSTSKDFDEVWHVFNKPIADMKVAAKQVCMWLEISKTSRN
ncbi:hypothetical protein ANCCAN_29545 [Ancylostoma caninum]|uniref:Uncharacterized protein n=1 Tax=Ancylostoma caninum TaxID=29170 RepID=A0A368EY72_ANCCA|nr:hypothetical protein ANCCAN_29545 [Ancylostoma caninum]